MTSDTALLAQVTGPESGADMVHRAIDMNPIIAAAAPRIDAEREIPEDLFAQLAGAGLYQLLVPHAFGGSELDPPVFLQVVEAVAKADASTAWCIAQTAVCSMAAAYLDPAVAREIFGSPRGVLAWGPPSLGAKAIATPDGYRVTGAWKFASGSRQATWLAGHCTLCDADGAPRTTQDGRPIERSMLFRRTAATITDVWHVVGLRGTGTDNYAVSDLFVPAAYSFGRDAVEDRQYPSALYRMSMFHMFAAGFGAIALGIAQATLDAFIQLARSKTPMLGKNLLSESSLVQSQLGHGQAQILAARTFLLQSVHDMWEGAVGSNITLGQRAAMRMASTYAIHQARDVVNTMYHAAGATAVFESNPYERRLRDVNAVTQQIQGHYSLFEIVGQHLLGMSPNFKLL
ncbi:MAG: acyl-CoA dehydrogenase [Rhizobiales bacterium]|nr:acyl-CoA dehydrogenase [Hyphomicrobiales bacterium]